LDGTSKRMKVANLGRKRKRPRKRLILIAGPCVIETRQITLRIAKKLKKIVSKHPVDFIFKASYDKANRSSIDSYRGVGLEEGLDILSEVREKVGVPVLSDVHSPEEAIVASTVLDILQIPAFLSRQTDLIVAAAATGRPVNIKKGQFLAPWDMKNVIEKATRSGGRSLFLTERGSCFGYNNLVSDMRSIPIMKQFGYPVLFDATHSVQRPGALGKSSGGDRELAVPLALAAVAAGADGLYIETHERPERALSDASSMLPLDWMDDLLSKAVRIREIALKTATRR